MVIEIKYIVIAIKIFYLKLTDLIKSVICAIFITAQRIKTTNEICILANLSKYN